MYGEEKYTIMQKVKFVQHIYPAKQYEFSVKLRQPPITVVVDGKSKTHDGYSEASIVQCYSKPSKISG